MSRGRGLVGFTQYGQDPSEKAFSFSTEQRRKMLANAMVVGQVGLAVASLYCQSGRLKMVNDSREGGREGGAYVDAPFLKPYKELIEEMRAELHGVGDEESITYDLRLKEILGDNGGMSGMHRFYPRISSRPSKKQRVVQRPVPGTTPEEFS